MFKKFFPLIIIPTGIFLEIYYYAWRFSSDNIPLWLSIIIGTGLTIMLTALIGYRQIKYAIPVAIVIAAYSVFATSAGQAFSLGISLKAEAQTAAQELYRDEMILEYTDEIERLKLQWEKIESDKAGTITTLEDQYEWKNTLARANEEQQIIDEKRSALIDKRNELRKQQTTHESVAEETTNIYKFYNQLFGISAKWLQFILQTILSVFIAIMAPAGMIMIDNRQVKTSVSTSEITPEMVDLWVRASWIPLRQKNDNVLLPKDTFFKYLEKKNIEFDEEVYDEIKKAAEEIKAVDDQTLTCDDEKQVKENLIKYFGRRRR